jgi:hypothetical protein
MAGSTPAEKRDIIAPFILEAYPKRKTSKNPFAEWVYAHRAGFERLL